MIRDLNDLNERPTREVATGFAGVFSFETVEACVQDSYRQLFNAATVTSYLPLLAERFARQRLRAAARIDAGEGRGRPSSRSWEKWASTCPESFPKPLTDDVIGAADLVVTMGCGDACPVLPGRRYADWLLDHPVGTTTATALAARDELRERVEDLIATLQEGTA